jgi:AAA15 family ATPase/GTPase
MLIDLTIHNYRFLQDFHIDGLAQVNLIVGSNNSGKTSLLEAIYLLVNQNNPQSMIDLLDNRGEVASSKTFNLSRSYQIKHLFSNHQINFDNNIHFQSGKQNPLNLQIQLTIAGNREELSTDIENETPLFTLNFYYNSHPGIEIPVYEDGTLDTRFFKNKSAISLLTFTPPACKFLTTANTNFNQLSILWDSINLTPKEDEVIKALQIIEPHVERISFTSSRSNSNVIIKMRGQSDPIPLGSMGDGMRRLLTLALSIVNVEKGFLLVDEIDTGLYYEVQADMWRLILETAHRLNIQVFATTHSWDCVRAFNEALEDTKNSKIGKLFRLDSKYGKIRAVEYVAEELRIAMQQNIEVR